MNQAALKITLAQINPIAGNIKNNAEKIINIVKKYNDTSDLIVFPELALCGYPAEDLILHNGFIKHTQKSIEVIKKHVKNDVIIGTPWEENDHIYNAAIHISNGIIANIIYKTHLPNYGVFDEKRVFTAGQKNNVIKVKDTIIGIGICEDFWFNNVSNTLTKQGAELLISINASPFDKNKKRDRDIIIQNRINETNLPIIYLNMVGGQDDLVFDGASSVTNSENEKLFVFQSFDEDIQTISYPFETPLMNTISSDPLHSVYQALCLGLRDYVHKNGFKGVILGLSGGIDSALSAVIACEALGADNVHCVMMPSQYTSQDSLDDAEQLTKNLGCSYKIISIDQTVNAIQSTLDNPSGVTAENIQSRTRGLLLMALSNQTGHMVLTTGNKSEMAVGYATIYGDMCGGFNALKDVYKTQVYALSQWINRDSEIIPDNIITRAPSAELRDDQTDQDSLPPYDILDAILERLIEHRLCMADIVKDGFEIDTVQHIRTLLDRNEYKRRQSAPGTKITSMAFGRDRRVPITNGFTG